MNRFKCNTSHTEFFIIPAFGIVYRTNRCKFSIAFAWLKYQIIINIGIKEDVNK